jgi:hypothetical protein
MSKSTPKRPAPEYRRLRIEVREDVAKRLDRSARLYSRYQTAGDVAAECVRLYLDLLEDVDRDTERMKKRIIRRELKRLTGGTKGARQS